MKILHSIIRGEGSPLLILHGFLGMADNWKTLGNKFAENGFQVHLIDQRNHGRSFHADAFSYTLMVDDLLQYIRYHQLKKVTIIGHSMGGKTAMFFAVSHPQLVTKLIVVDIAPRYYIPHHTETLQGLNAMELDSIKSRGEADGALAVYVPEFSMRQFLLKSLYRTSEKKFAFRFHLSSLTDNFEAIGEALPAKMQYSGDTLFLKGEHAGYISEEDTPGIKTCFPGAVIEEIKDAGHWIHADQPQTFFEKTMRFLRSNIR